MEERHLRADGQDFMLVGMGVHITKISEDGHMVYERQVIFPPPLSARLVLVRMTGMRAV
jgi:hypothetical protein